MKLKRYAVSVQWGEGYHYFLSYHDDKESTLDFAKERQKQEDAIRDKRKNRGAKPTVHVWEMLV